MPAAVAALWTLVPAGARAAEAAAAGFAPAGSIVTGVALAAALYGVFHFRRRALAAEAATVRLATEASLDDAIAAARREEVICRRLSDGAETASPGTAELIGMAAGPDGVPGTGGWMGALASCLAAADASALRAQVAALRDSGAGFRGTFSFTDAGHRLEIIGTRAAGPDGAPICDLLLIRDRTQEADEFDRLSATAEGFRRLVDFLPLPVWLRDGDLRLSYVNRAYREAVEADAGTPPGAMPEIAGGAQRGDGRSLAKEALATGTVHSERDHLVMGGERRLVGLCEAPISDADAGASFAAIAGYALDHTAVEEAEAELVRHIAGHEEVLQSLGTAIAIYGPDESLQFFNNAYLQLWRLDEGWLRTKPRLGEVLEELRLRQRLPEVADFPAYKAEILKLFTSLIEPIEELVHLPDGTMLRSMVTPHPFGGLMRSWEDVTDALRLEQSYNTLIAVQRETLDNLYEGVAVIGGDGRLRLSNPEFGAMWEIPADVLGSGPHITEIVDLMRPLLAGIEDWTAEKERVISVLTDRKPGNGRIERLDGKVLDYATVPLPDGAVLLSYLDVTAAINMERALRERNEALETADRLKSEFIANVSYELRTPLNTIIGFTEILTGQYFGELNPRQQEYGRGILESSNRLLVLINDILDLASIEAGHMTLELDKIDLRELLIGSLGLVRERARRKNLQLECDCPHDIGHIIADERRLKQVLFNILSNSVKFTPDNGSIVLSARRNEDEIVLTTVDTGIGIAEEDHARVFDKFERGTHPEARRSGAGLGLSLVKSFIELHGGHVVIESQPSVGTKVVCSLPARRLESAAMR